MASERKERSCLMGMNIDITTRHTLTSAPITPKLVSRRYSKGLDLLDVFKKAYRYNGIWAVFWKAMALRFSLILITKFQQMCSSKKITTRWHRIENYGKLATRKHKLPTNLHIIIHIKQENIVIICGHRIVPLRNNILVSGWEATHWMSKTKKERSNQSSKLNMSFSQNNK